MIRRSAFIALARAANAVFFLVTSLYCLLTYHSFAYQQFIRPHLILAVAGFAVWNGLFYWLTLLLTAATFHPLRTRGWAVWSYLTGSAILGLWLIVGGGLPSVDNTGRSLVLALAALALPIWLAVVDHGEAAREHPARLALSTSGGTRVWRTAIIGALVVWAAYALTAPLRLSQTGDIALGSRGLVLGLSSSLAAHVTAFAMGCLVLVCLGGMADLTPWPGPAQYWLLVAAFAVAVGVTTMQIVFAPIVFGGPAAWLVAAVTGVAFALIWSSIARYRYGDAPEPRSSALDAWFAPVITTRSRLTALGGCAIMPWLAYELTARAALFDWDFMMQKLVALTLWLPAIAFAHAIASDEARRPSQLSWVVPAALVLCLYGADAAAVPRLPDWLGDVKFRPDFVLDGYAATNPSFRVIREALHPDTNDDPAFDRYLKANTIIEHDQLKPIDIDYVRPLRPTTARKPNIFLFAIDSLRRDYVSAYNPAVTFTPALGRLAADSFVFDRAFTRYGGTAMAVPSIWAGGLLIHKQYLTPFDPMNSLLKLVKAEDYQLVLSVDTQMGQLLPHDLPLIEINRGIDTPEHDMCRTVDEMSRALATKRNGRPVFAWALPQNIHVSRTRTGSVPPGESYPGFFAPYASRLRHIDDCFGRFLDDLKRDGLYDDSIIIVTSDHGDSLGEQLRWGHAFTIFPEVMRVPLIVHLPLALRDQVSADLGRVAFSSDIVPTLYALLGYAPAPLGHLYGAPLFVAPGTDLSARRRESFLIASSYGPVYGMLRHNGRGLYIQDAINGTEFAYDLSQGFLGARVGVSDDDRALNRGLIRDQVAELAAAYHFTPHP